MAIKYVDRLEDISDFSGAYYVNCPFCVDYGKSPDTEHKLGVTFGSVNKYNCYRCPASGVAEDLFENRINRRTYFSNIVKKVHAPRPLFQEERVVKELIDYHNISIKIEPHHVNAVAYLKRRNIGDELIKKYDLRIGDHSNFLYKNRILVPTFDSWGNCVYVVARDYMESSSMKYRNPPETHKAYAVWNGNRITEGCTVLVNEGTFSGIASGRHCPEYVPVAIFGKLISDQQAKLIAKKKPGRIILSLDGDVNEKTLDQNRDIVRKFYRGAIHVARLPDGEDPDSLSGDEYRDIIGASMKTTLNIRI